MNRRRFLQSALLGSFPTVAGCLEFPRSTQTAVSPTQTATSATEVTTEYPRFSAAYYEVTAKRAGDPEGTPVAFADLPAGARVELANAIGRDRYVVGRPPDLLQSDLHREVLSYRGSAFEVSISVADRFGEPTHGPDGDPNWIEPVDLTVDVEGGELAITVTNGLDTGLAVHHYGQPYLGVLVAASESPSVLDHDHYEANGHIRTSGVVTTERVPADAWRTETLSPDGSFRESYLVPDGLPKESTVWFALPIGDDSVELFDNRSTLLTAAISLEA